MNQGSPQEVYVRYWDMKQPLRVLVLERNAADAERNLSELRGAGFVVQAQVSAKREEFLERLREGEFDVILADYCFPSGIELDCLLVVRNLAKDTPFVLVTDTLGEVAAVECFRRGVTDYVLKSHLTRLPGVVSRALEEKCLRDARAIMIEALKRSEEGFRLLFENNPLPMWVFDRDTLQFLQVNDAAISLYGYTREEFLRMRLTDVRLPEDVPVLLEALQKVQWPYWRAGAARHRCKDGRLMDVEIISHSMEYAGRKAALSVAQDVTERRAMELHLRQIQKFEAVGQLAGGIAHDFNNVIGAIIGWADLGHDLAADKSRVQTYFAKIRDQADRAAALTRQLLAFARRQILEPRHLSLNQTVLDLLSLLEKVIGKDIEVQTDLAADLALIQADPTQIEQVLMNLCLNARDAMPGGGRLIIETRTEACDAVDCARLMLPHSGRYVLLRVADTGTGMDAATRERIFEPFFTTKEPGKGTGLGLATVYGIVKQHGGAVHVDTELGRGSAFRIFLPVAEDGKESAQFSPRHSDEAPRRGTETILVAEDHDGVRETARATLEGLGYRVLLANDGAQAMEAFNGHRNDIDLILLDIVMPKLNGSAVYAQVSALKPDVRIVFSTGYSTEAAELTEMARQGMPILQKPYTPAALGRKVREILDRAPVTLELRSSRERK